MRDDQRPDYEGRHTEWVERQRETARIRRARHTTAGRRPAFQFFFGQTRGDAWAAHRATMDCATAQQALTLARAENIAKREGVVFVWDYDNDADMSWLEQTDARGRYLFPKSYREKEHEVLWCRAVRPCPDHGIDCRHTETLASLSGIVDASPEYRRVVEAELALDVTLESARHAVPKTEGAA